MKNRQIKLLTRSVAGLLLVGFPATQQVLVEKAAQLDSPNYYSLLATAIDASDTNTFEDNRNPQIFDSTNEAFINAVSARKDVDTYANSIEATSAYNFSEKYSSTFSTSVNANVHISGVTTDVYGKFDTNAKTENWKQQIEDYQYYYWLAQKYIVNIDWNNGMLSHALTGPFERELNSVDSVTSAKALLRKYGTHVYSTYILGGKLEISKYFTKDASYELSDSEKSVASSLNVIVDTAKIEAKLDGSVNLSSYESNSSTSSHYYSKLNYHSYGGEINGAASASDLFQYKTQFGTGTSSGFLYEAWTNSFNNDGVALKIVSAENAVPVWELLDKSTYGEQIPLLEKAFDNRCYESYAKKCNAFNVPCRYFDSLSYVSHGTKVNITPKSSTINLPENSSVKVKLSNLVTSNSENCDYQLRLSPNSFATLDGDILNIKSGTTGEEFCIELLINGRKAYELAVNIKKEFYSGGYGTEQQPYLINSKRDLLSFLSDFSDSDHYYQLSSDINLEGEKIDTGGSGTSSAFEGIFDGNYHSITNCTVKANSFDNGFPYRGLFGRNDGTIKNLTLNKIVCLPNGLIDVMSDDVRLSAGILTGFNAGVISNCKVINSAIRIPVSLEKAGSELNVGGLVGYTEGLIEHSFFSGGNIYGIAQSGKGSRNIGGIVGNLSGAKISESYVSLSKLNIYNSEKIRFSLGGIAGNRSPKRNGEDSETKPKLSMCLVYDVSTNKEGNTFGYIAGTEVDGEFSNCYYKAIKEQSVAGHQKSNCYRKDNLNLLQLPSLFEENWRDGPNGPVLKP